MERILERELNTHKYVVINPVGVSMRPLLYQGRDHVVVQRPTGEFKAGDLPIYRLKEGCYVLHRLLRADENFYYIRGDNCIRTEIVPKSQVVGVVTKICRKGRYIEMDDPAYLRYIRLWNGIFPLRRCWYRMRGRTVSIKCRMENIWSKIKRQLNS